MADTLKDFSVIIKSRFPLVEVETGEEVRMMKLLERSANLEGWPLFVWSIADGIRRVPRTDVITQTYEFRDALRHIDKTPQNGVYTMLDAHPYLEDPVNVRLIKEIAQEYYRTARTLVFISREIELPPELSRMSARFELPLPDTTMIREMIKEEAQVWERDSGQSLKGQQQALDLLVQHLAGMAEEDARRLIRNAIHDDGAITLDDIGRVLKFKRESIADGELLDFEIDTANFADIGGLANLKRWLELRRPAIAGDAARLGVEPPKGVLLLGVQGSGKSLAAKAVAGSWGLPLIRLDFAVLYNKFHGETERNLRDALKQAEAMAPCVLWIDEIEKGLAADESGSGDGGVSRRVLGTLLTWMAERQARVFMVATANDVSQLPPELMRKGRMDEIFFVDLPDAAVREEIFRIHLKKRKLDPAQFDVPQLARAADGFAGAEIEQAIVSGIYEAMAAKEPLSTKHILTELAHTKPLSVVMAEKIEALRQWAAERTVSAG
jgi:SpoVK/Ycf46/Vps4 family AAA+-type ATPase